MHELEPGGLVGLQDGPPWARPRALLFDLDGTLICESSRRRDFLALLAARYARHLEPFSPAEAALRLEEQFTWFWNDADRHRVWRARPLAEARRHVTEQAFARLRADGAHGAVPTIAQAFGEEFHRIRHADLACIADAHETLRQLQRRGVRLALVTNGSSQTQREKIERFGLAAYFDHIQIEGEHDFGKPDERAYRHALAQLGVDPSEAWMVGDNLEWEVWVPQRIGLRGIWFDHFRDGLAVDAPGRPDHVARTLSELPGLYDRTVAAVCG